MQKLKKFLIVSTMSVTVFSMCAFVAPKADAASAGDLIKMNGLSSVYYLAGDGKRYVFPNESTYFSWYSDFSGVVTVSQSELEALPLGANVTVRPGTKLVKITTNPKVYAVVAGGNLIAVPDEATALALFGANWNKRIIDVSDAFFTNYKIAAGTLSSTAYPAGSLVKFGTGADVYYIGSDGKARKISNEAAFNANRFKWNDVITTSMAIPATGSDITGAESALTDTSSGAGGVAYTGGSGLTVALSGDTLGSTNIPASASLVPFVTVNLTAANDGAVTVSDMTFTRFGTGLTSDFSGGYLYAGDTRLTNIRSVDSSNNTITFSSVNFTIPAGQTKAVTLKMNASATAAGSHSFKLAAASAISASGASVSGSFPVTGNMMSFSNSVSAATLTLTSSAGTADKKVGESQALIGEYTIANNGTQEDVNIYRIKFKQDGDASNDAVKNFSLDLDGTKVVSNVQMVDKYVDFVLATPFLLKKSTSITATVRGDIAGDINKTVELYLSNVADMEARGSAYGNFYSAAITNGWTDTSVNVVTVKGSNINVSLDGPTAQDIKKNTANIVLAKLLMKTDNEDVNIENLRMTITMPQITGQNGALNNVKMVDSSNNSSYSVVSDPVGTALIEPINFENVYLKKGVQYTFEIKGDVPDTATTTASYKVTVDFTVLGGSTKGRYVTSDTALITGDFSATTLVGQPMSVAYPSVSFNKITTNDNTVVKSALGVLLYKGKITASAVDNLKVSKISMTASTTGTALSGNFDRVYLYQVNSDGSEVKLADVTNSSLPSTVSSTGSVTFSGFNLEIPKGISGTQYFAVRGDVKSAVTAGSVQFGLKNSTATGTDYTVRDSGSNALTAAYIVGNVALSHTTTIATRGTMTMDFDTNEAGINVNKNVLAGSTFLVGRVKLTAQKEDAKVIDLSLQDTGNTNDSDVGSLYLYKDKEMTQLVGATGLGSSNLAKFENLNFVVPTTGTTYLYLAAMTKAVDYSVSPASASTGHAERTVIFKIFDTAPYATKVRGVSTGDDYTNGVDATVGATVSKTGTMLGAVISGITTDFPNGSLSNGAGQKVFSFKITVPTPSANVAYDGTALGAQLATTTFAISTTSGVVLSGYKVQRVGGALGKVAASITGSVINWATTYGASSTDLIVRPGETATYEIYADITGVTTNSSAQVSISDLTTFFYNHTTTNGNTYTGSYYPIISGVSDVIGGRLTN